MGERARPPGAKECAAVHVRGWIKSDDMWEGIGDVRLTLERPVGAERKAAQSLAQRAQAALDVGADREDRLPRRDEVGERPGDAALAAVDLGAPLGRDGRRPGLERRLELGA